MRKRRSARSSRVSSRRGAGPLVLAGVITAVIAVIVVVALLAAGSGEPPVKSTAKETPSAPKPIPVKPKPVVSTPEPAPEPVKPKPAPKPEPKPAPKPAPKPEPAKPAPAKFAVDSIDEPGDWPMWRFDERRSASSPHALPDRLSLLWVRDLGPSRPAWPKSQQKLQFDVAPQPVAMGRRIFVPSNTTDSVTAYDTGSGEELWRFYAEAPVRFAPVAHAGKVTFVSDDGHLYCLDAANGALKWKVNGGPADRRIIGNHRLVSSWPARGGPVLADGKIYFAASIWSFMGVFIHAVDAESGEIVWTNSGDGMNYTVQPHGAPSFATVVPQGHLAVAGGTLIVPGGRSSPAGYDARTGRLKYFRFDGRNGSHEVVASADTFYLPRGTCRVEDGRSVSEDRPEVLDDRFLVYADGDEVEIKSSLAEVRTREVKDRRGRKRKVSTYSRKTFLTFDTHAEGDVRVHLRAGSRIYTSDDKQLAAFDLLAAESDPDAKPTWTGRVDGDIWTMLAADRKLFVVTTDGKLHCFGEGAGEAKRHALAFSSVNPVKDKWVDRADEILGNPGAGVGFGLVLGLGSGRLAEELIRQSELHLVAVDPDAAKVDAFRRKMQSAGHYGSRVSAIVGDLATVGLPRYFANLIVSEDPDVFGFSNGKTFVRKVFEALRPYGGQLCLRLPQAEHRGLAADVRALKDPQARLSRKGTLSRLVREGALPETGDWTHNYADAGQTGISLDALVKAPLGILWFGGPSHDKILPRHGHGPSPQVAAGRLFIEGPDMLRCVDVYTGRVWWEKTLRDFGKYYDITSHFPGAGEIGSNYVSLADRVYAVYGNAILELDSATGELVKEFKLEVEPGKEAPNWGYIGVLGDYLVATSSPVPIQISSSRSKSKSKLPKGLTEIFKKNAEWKYLAGTDPEKNWTSPDYDDSSWKTGRAGFGYGDGDDKTVLRDMRNKYGRVYIRKTFELKSVPEAEVGLAINFDDSFIATLNGKEVIREGVEKGSGADAGGIDGHEADGHEYFPIRNAKELLREGTNLIALEGHNSGKGSSDFSLDPYLVRKGKPEASVVKAGKPEPPKDAKALLPKGRYASGSRRLIVFDRHSGKLLWQRDAEFNFRHNNIALGAGKVFCIDSMTDARLKALARRGLALEGKPVIYALDIRTGREAWSHDRDVTGTFVNYDAKHDIVVQGGSRNRDRARDEQGRGLVAYRGKDGETLWKSDRSYSGPVLMWKDKLITNGNSGVALDIRTGEEFDLKFRRMYGCNYVIGSQNMLTFRSGAAGFYDLLNQSGTGNFGGFKSSCTPNLIPANGVLNAPDYTRTCSCAYQNQSSLALVHMPEAEYWTFGGVIRDGKTGLNFGAPGDRRAPNGTLWLDVPSVGGPSAKVAVEMEPKDPEVFRVHASAVADGELKWVAASGVKDVSRIDIEVEGEGPHTLRMHFLEPDPVGAGKRVFNVDVQGKKVLEAFDIVKEAGGSRRAVVREFTVTPKEGRIVIEFEPMMALPPLISGVELLASRQ